MEQGDLRRAEALVTAVLAAQPDRPDALGLLANLQFGLLAYDDSEITLERLITMAPADADVSHYLLFAKLRATKGDKVGVRAVLKQAMARHPRDVKLAIAHAALAPDVQQSCAELEDFLGRIAGIPNAVAHVLKEIIIRRAHLRRVQMGLTDMGVSWEDTRDRRASCRERVCLYV